VERLHGLLVVPMATIENAESEEATLVSRVK
jgi:hypothetical protein